MNEAEIELITRGAPPHDGRGHSMPANLWRPLLTNRSLIALGLLYLCGSFGWSFFASWMPKYMNEMRSGQLTAAATASNAPATGDAKGAGPAEPEKPKDAPPPRQGKRKTTEFKVNWKNALPLFFGGISCLVGGALCNVLVARHGKDKKWTRAIFPVSGYIVAASAMALIPFVKDEKQAIILLCIAEVAHDFGQGANWATIVDIGGSYAGVAAGLINTIGNLGNAFQPAIGAQIKEAFGWNTLFVVYSVAFLLAATMWIFINPCRTFYADHEQRA